MELQAGAEGEEAAIAVADDEFAGVPGHVAEVAGEGNGFGGVFGIEGVGVVDVEIRVEEFLFVFFGVGRGRRGAAEVDGVVVAHEDGVDGGILPGADAGEAELVLIPGNGAGDVGGEEDGDDLADHAGRVAQGTAAVFCGGGRPLGGTARNIPGIGQQEHEFPLALILIRLQRVRREVDLIGAVREIGRFAGDIAAGVLPAGGGFFLPDFENAIGGHAHAAQDGRNAKDDSIFEIVGHSHVFFA